VRLVEMIVRINEEQGRMRSEGDEMVNVLLLDKIGRQEMVLRLLIRL
jgi:hypothetical protein